MKNHREAINVIARPDRVKMFLLATAIAVLGSCGGESALVPIAELSSGDYAITLLAESSELQQNANRMALEFRDAASNELVSVENLQIQASMAMPGMAPMFADVSTPGSSVTGRYEFSTDFSMAGGWSLTVTFDTDRRVQFNVNAF